MKNQPRFYFAECNDSNCLISEYIPCHGHFFRRQPYRAGTRLFSKEEYWPGDVNCSKEDALETLFVLKQQNAITLSEFVWLNFNICHTNLADKNHTVSSALESLRQKLRLEIFQVQKEIIQILLYYLVTSF